MLKKLYIVLLLTTLTFLPFISIARPQFTSPDECPSISYIQNEGLQDIIGRSHNMWFGRNTSYYGTNSEWVFVIAWFHASSYEEALKQSKQALMKLSGNPIPMKDMDNTSGYNFDWICIYQTNANLTAIAGLYDLD